MLMSFPKQQQQQAQKVCAFLLCFRSAEPKWSTCCCMANTAPLGGEGRQRRLRSWWRHVQQSVAMALSAAAHHSYDKVAAGRAQTTDRAGEAAHRAPRRQMSRAAGEAVIFELFDEDTAGVRPGFSQSSGRRNESSGTPWSTSSTSSRPWCRFSTLLCRRRWNSCKTCSSSSTGVDRSRAGYRSAQDLY